MFKSDGMNSCLGVLERGSEPYIGLDDFNHQEKC